MRQSDLGMEGPAQGKPDIYGVFCFVLKILFIYFLERGEGRKREREKYHCVVASRMPHPGALARNPGMCPDWGLNR